MRALVENSHHHRRRSGLPGCLAARRQGVARMGDIAQGGGVGMAVSGNPVQPAKSRLVWGPFTGLGLLAALAALLLDQASKLWLLFVYDLEGKGAVALAPFFDLVLV